GTDPRRIPGSALRLFQPAHGTHPRPLRNGFCPLNFVLPMKKIIIIGASSGIGRELARLYAGEGALVGATGRRQELLYSLQLEYPNHVVTECFDATEKDMTVHLDSLVQKLGGLDMLIYSAGWGEPQEALEYAVEKATVDINVNGFLEAIFFGWRLFTGQGHGHLVT